MAGPGAEKGDDELRECNEKACECQLPHRFSAEAGRVCTTVMFFSTNVQLVQVREAEVLRRLT